MHESCKRCREVNRVIRVDDSAGLSGDILVDQTHGFFYDHPLDHVPGLLLIESALQAAGHWSEHHAPGAHLGFLSVRFRRYCLHGRPLRWSLSHISQTEDRVRLEVRIIQEDETRTEISLELMRHPRGPRSYTGLIQQQMPARLVAAAPARLNKHDTTNVMISKPQVGSDNCVAWLLPAADGNLLADSVDCDHWHPLYLLEGWMQVLRYTNSDPTAQTQRIRDILTGIELRLYAPVPRAVPLALSVEVHQQTENQRLIRSGSIGNNEQVFANIRMLTARPQSNSKRAANAEPCA